MHSRERLFAVNLVSPPGVGISGGWKEIRKEWLGFIQKVVFALRDGRILECCLVR